MKIRIKENLKNSFNSMLFYLCAVLFLLFCTLYFFIRNQFFTGNGNSSLLMYFTAVPYISCVIIPALCYKTSRMIYDNFVPLTSLNKIINNFLTILIQYIILLFVLLPGCFMVNLFGSVDWGQVFTSYFCLMIYGAVLISLCLFFNELFSSSIVSLIVSVVFLFIFNTIHLAAVYITISNTLASILKNFSFAWHFDAASKGIVDTRDITYLFSFTILFLLLSAFVKDKKAGFKVNKNFFIEKAVYAVIAVLILLNGQRWYARLDLSKGKTYSLSKYTKNLCSSLEDNLKITYYRSGNLSKLYPQVRDVNDFLTAFCSSSKKITYILKDTDKDTESAQLLQNYGVNPQQLRTADNNSTQFIDVYSCIIAEYNGNAQFIPFELSSQTLEYDLDCRIKNLISGEQRVVNILCGNGMSLYEDYGYVIPWLNSQGFLCNPLYTEEPNFAESLELCSGPLVVLGDSEIKIDAAIAIENYILNEKGNAFFAVSPYSADIENDWSITANSKTDIVEMLENWGVRFTDEICADVSCARITMSSEDENQDPFVQENTVTQILNYPLWINLLPQENTPGGITLFWPVKLELSGNASPYLVTSPAAYTYKTDKNSPSRLIETNPFTLNTINTSDKEKETLITGARITGPLQGLYNLNSCNNSDIIVLSDQYFVNTLMNGYVGNEYADYRNFEFLGNVLLKLNKEYELAELHQKTGDDTSLYKITDAVQFTKTAGFVYLLLIIIIPFLIIICGILVKIISSVLRKKHIKEVL